MPISDPKQSKIKMTILTKGKNKNLVWWSPIKQNKRRSELIVQDMIKRFMRQAHIVRVTNVLMFYENEILIAKANFNGKDNIKQN